METIQVPAQALMRGNREDDLMFVFRAHQHGIAVDDLVSEAEKIRAFMESAPAEGRPEWSTVSTFADLLDERDRARATAVRLEQELAEAERKLAEENDDLVKGVLLEVRRLGGRKNGPEWSAICDVVNRSAEHFGVQIGSKP